MARQGIVADITALKAVDVAGVEDGTYYEVTAPVPDMETEVYQYLKFKDWDEGVPAVVTPDAGQGCWVASKTRTGYGATEPPANFPFEFRWVNTATGTRYWHSRASQSWAEFGTS